MPKKSKLLEKILSKPAPTSFTIRELDALMKQCGCEKFEGGRGSGIAIIMLKPSASFNLTVHTQAMSCTGIM